MAENQNASGAVADATPEAAPSVPGIQQAEGWTADDIATIIDGRLEQFGQRLYGGLDRRFTTLEQRAARFDEIDHVKEAITNLMGETKLSREIVRQALRGELTEESTKALESAHEAATEKARSDAENARLRAQVETVTKTAAEIAAAERGMTLDQTHKYEYEQVYGPMALAWVELEGLAWSDVYDQLPAFPPRATPDQRHRWVTAVRTLAKDVADKKLKDARPKVVVPSSRPVAAAAAEPVSNKARLVRYFTEHPDG